MLWFVEWRWLVMLVMSDDEPSGRKMFRMKQKQAENNPEGSMCEAFGLNVNYTK